MREFAAKNEKAPEISGARDFAFRREGLLDVLASLLPVALARQRFLGPLLLSGLQIKRMALDLFDDVLLLDLPLEAPQSAFERLALLDMDFSQ
jgi:hypothetical protein